MHRPYLLLVVCVLGVLAIGLYLLPSEAERVPITEGKLVYHGAGIAYDTETGCEYVIYSGIYPRMGADGKQICRGTK